MSNTDLLKALARAKVAFQLRTLEAVICAPTHKSKPDQNMPEAPVVAKKEE